MCSSSYKTISSLPVGITVSGTMLNLPCNTEFSIQKYYLFAQAYEESHF